MCGDSSGFCFSFSSATLLIQTLGFDIVLFGVLHNAKAGAIRSLDMIKLELPFVGAYFVHDFLHKVWRIELPNWRVVERCK